MASILTSACVAEESFLGWALKREAERKRKTERDIEGAKVYKVTRDGEREILHHT